MHVHTPASSPIYTSQASTFNRGRRGNRPLDATYRVGRGHHGATATYLSLLSSEKYVLQSRIPSQTIHEATYDHVRNATLDVRHPVIGMRPSVSNTESTGRSQRRPAQSLYTVSKHIYKLVSAIYKADISRCTATRGTKRKPNAVGSPSALTAMQEFRRDVRLELLASSSKDRTRRYC